MTCRIIRLLIPLTLGLFVAPFAAEAQPAGKGVPAVLEQKAMILWKCVYFPVPLKDSPDQRFSSIICVDEARRFPPHHGLRKYRLLFFVRLLTEPLDSRTASHVTQVRDIA
jgi:hypothetical protein